MSDDVLVRVENVSKRFCRSLKRSLWYGLQDLGSEVGGRRHGGGRGLPLKSSDVQLRQDEFWALTDVSFDLSRGECLGLIGRNGAGKTTLLRILNNLIKPDTGTIEIRGRLEALIALGAGFNPLLTGRENIYTSLSILGRSTRATKQLIDDIIDFSGISEFIDSPVQYYSSGMQVRLGFAIASSVDPDVLLVDEVLAVGDYKFRGQCYNRLNSLKKSSSIIVVSHSTSDLARLCDIGLVLQKGISQKPIPIQDALVKYSDAIDSSSNDSVTGYYFPPISGYEISSVDVRRDSCNSSSVSFQISIESDSFIPKSRLRVIFISTTGHVAGEWDSAIHGTTYEINRGSTLLEISINPIRLSSGSYYMTIILSLDSGNAYYINSGHDIAVEFHGLSLGGAYYKI